MAKDESAYKEGLDLIYEDFLELSDHHQTQIIMASSGCISGTLSEWPHLLSALVRLGFDVTQKTPAIDAREICRTILKDRIQ